MATTNMICACSSARLHMALILFSHQLRLGFDLSSIHARIQFDMSRWSFYARKLSSNRQDLRSVQRKGKEIIFYEMSNGIEAQIIEGGYNCLRLVYRSPKYVWILFSHCLRDSLCVKKVNWGNDAWIFQIFLF